MQVLVSALGAADDSGLLRFGMVLYTRQGEYCSTIILCNECVLYCTMLYTREGEYLHGLHEKDSGLGEMGFIDI